MATDISLIILNYNGAAWLERCFESICAQTAVDRLEVLVSDNGSRDDSELICRRFQARLPALTFIANGKNLWYCEANNIGAAQAQAPLLFFLNNDLWLEPDCVQLLLASAATQDAQIFAPRVLNYADDTFQGFGASGLDVLGCCVGVPDHSVPREIFSAYGCAFVIRKAAFDQLGGFPPELLIYTDELDLAWRVWASGGRVLTMPGAKVHHRGAAVVNPDGGSKHTELRTTELKRFLAVRNGILLLMKNPQHLLFLLLFSHLVLLLCEALVFLVFIRKWRPVRRSYVAAMVDALRMHAHVRAWRKRNQACRRYGDLALLRFIRPNLGRWVELKQVLRLGLPKIDAA